MFLLREAEKAIQAEYHNDEMKTPMHMSMGEEAIAVGICAALGDKARIWGTYRSHAIYLARTGDVKGFFAELYGKSTGPGGGRAGSMHLADPDQGIVMASAVVATGIPVALGAAFASRVLNNGNINAVFFGDGAVDEGVFWESVNLASLWQLPVLFVCEDNGLAIHTSTTMRRGYDGLRDVLSGFRCHFLEYAGTDVQQIYNLAKTAIGHREYNPVILSLKYYRYLEHVGVNEDFQAGYRSKDQFIKWKEIDPIDIQRKKLISTGLAEEVAKAEFDVLDQIKDAIALAKAAPYPAPESLQKEVFCGE